MVNTVQTLVKVSDTRHMIKMWNQTPLKSNNMDDVRKHNQMD